MDNRKVSITSSNAILLNDADNIIIAIDYIWRLKPRRQGTQCVNRAKVKEIFVICEDSIDP